MCHSSACGGHFAVQKTSDKILQSGFYWPVIFKDAHHRGEKIKSLDEKMPWEREEMVAVISPLSPCGFMAIMTVIYHRGGVSCVSVTLLSRSWNMRDCTYSLCDVIVNSAEPLL